MPSLVLPRNRILYAPSILPHRATLLPPALGLGGDVVTNGNMETGSPPTGWSAVNGAVPSSQSEERTGGSGSKSLQLLRSGNSFFQAKQALVATAGGWYLWGAWHRNVDSSNGVYIELKSQVGTTLASTAGAVGTSWVQKSLVARATDGQVQPTLSIWGTVDGTGGRFDDASLKPILLPSMHCGGLNAQTVLVRASFRPSTTLATGRQLGARIAMDNPSNPATFVDGYIDLATNKMYLVKYVNGTPTDLTSGNITYAATKVGYVEIVGTPSAATARIYYDGTQVGSDQVLGDLTSGYGTHVRWWTTDEACGVVAEARRAA